MVRLRWANRPTLALSKSLSRGLHFIVSRTAGTLHFTKRVNCDLDTSVWATEHHTFKFRTDGSRHNSSQTPTPHTPHTPLQVRLQKCIVEFMTCTV